MFQVIRLLFIAVFGLAVGFYVWATFLSSKHARGQALPGAPNAVTTASFTALHRAFLQRLFLEPYRRQPGADPRGTAFIERMCSYLPAQWTVDDMRSLKAEGAALAALPAAADDPATALRAGILEDHPTRQSELFARALAKSDTGAWHPFFRFTAAATAAANAATRKVPAAEQAKSDRLALDLLRTSLAKSPFSGTDLYSFEWRLQANSTESLRERVGPELATIITQAPGMPRWLSDLVSGRQALREAWDARGEDYANRVTQAGWRGFQDGIKRARAFLVSSWEGNPKYPAAPALMISVTMAESEAVEGMRIWFDRAVAAQIDYVPAYGSLRNGLQPRWLGKGPPWDPHAELRDLADECRALERYDTLVPLQYVHLSRFISRDRNPRPFFEGWMNYRRGQEILERYAQTPNSPISPRFARTFAAIRAFQAGHPDEARRHLAAVENRASEAGELTELQSPSAMLRELGVAPK